MNSAGSRRDTSKNKIKQTHLDQNQIVIGRISSYPEYPNGNFSNYHVRRSAIKGCWGPIIGFAEIVIQLNSLCNFNEIFHHIEAIQELSSKIHVLASLSVRQVSGNSRSNSLAEKNKIFKCQHQIIRLVSELTP